MSADDLVTIEELRAAIRAAAEAELGDLVDAIAERVAEVHGLAAADVRRVVEGHLDLDALASRVVAEAEARVVYN